MKAQLSKLRRGPAVHIPTARPRRESLEDLAGQVARGVIAPVIEKTFGFEDAAAALRLLESEHARARSWSHEVPMSDRRGIGPDRSCGSPHRMCRPEQPRSSKECGFNV